MRRNRLIAGLICGLLLLGVSAAWGAKLVLKNGKVLNGTVIQQGSNYWIKLADGTSQIVSGDDVASYDAEATVDAADPASLASAAFREAKMRADAVSIPLGAVVIWQEFIDKYPNAADLPQAKSELERWNQLQASRAEKINGKWVGGEDIKKIHEEADPLIADGLSVWGNHQTLLAIQKLQQAVKIYPNSYIAQFTLGDISIVQSNFPDAIKYFQAASNLRPKAVAPLNNMGVANFKANHLDTSIKNFYAAVQIQDTRDVVANLIFAMDHDDGVRTAPKNKTMLDAARLLAAKYDIAPNTNTLYLMPPETPAEANVAGSGTETWTGSGFFISADGLVLTNRHVALGLENPTQKPDPRVKTSLLVVVGKKQYSATPVAVDTEFDLALLKINLQTPNFVHLSPLDIPNTGAECIVMGFPLETVMGDDVKVTAGIVSSNAADGGLGRDVVTDAKINPGNSGGPIFDKFGNVMAVAAAKTVIGDADSYGIGISAGHVRDFLKRNHVTVTDGPTTTPLSTEDIVSKAKPAMVYIIGTNSGLPVGNE